MAAVDAMAAAPAPASLAQVGLHAGGVHGTGKDETLAVRAVLAAQAFELGAGLDALGDDRQPQGPAQLDQRVQEGGRLAGTVDGRDEGAVDLELVDGEPAEVGQRGLPRSEVVNGDLDAQLLEPAQVRHRGLGVADQDRLGHLQGHVARDRRGWTQGLRPRR